MNYVYMILHLLKKYMYEFNVNVTTFDVRNGIQSCFNLRKGDLFSIENTSSGVFFTTSNSNWQEIIEEVLPFVEVKDVKINMNFGVTHFSVSLKIKNASLIVNRYADSLKKYCKTGVYVKGDKIIVNSDESLLEQLGSIKIFNKDIKKFQNHVMVCSGYISGEKLANQKPMEHEAKLQEKPLEDVMLEKYGVYAGDVIDGSVVEYKPREFGLDSVKIDKVLLSNQFSDFIEHIEITKSALIMVVRPKYFKLLYNYFTSYSLEKIVVVVNGKVYYMPSTFITNDMVSCRLVCSLDAGEDVFQQCNSGFMNVSFVREVETDMNHMEIMMILLGLIILICLILILFKKRRKAFRQLMQMMLNGFFLSSADLYASLAVMPFLYIITYSNNGLILPVIFVSWLSYMFSGDLLLVQWSWYVLCQSLLFIGCWIIFVLIPRSNVSKNVQDDNEKTQNSVE